MSRLWQSIKTAFSLVPSTPCIPSSRRTMWRSRCRPSVEVRIGFGISSQPRVFDGRKSRRLRQREYLRNRIFPARAVEDAGSRSFCHQVGILQYRVTRVLICVHHASVINVLVHICYCVPCYACHYSFPRYINSK